jgi:hypothetical protein
MIADSPLLSVPCPRPNGASGRCLLGRAMYKQRFFHKENLHCRFSRIHYTSCEPELSRFAPSPYLSRASDTAPPSSNYHRIDVTRW